MSETTVGPWGYERGGSKTEPQWEIAPQADIELGHWEREVALVVSSEADAKFIVRACNAHADLVEALELVELNFQRNRVSGNWQGDDEHEAWTAVTAALAKAKGK